MAKHFTGERGERGEHPLTKGGNEALRNRLKKVCWVSHGWPERRPPALLVGISRLRGPVPMRSRGKQWFKQIGLIIPALNPGIDVMVHASVITACKVQLLARSGVHRPRDLSSVAKSVPCARYLSSIIVTSLSHSLACMPQLTFPSSPLMALSRDS